MTCIEGTLPCIVLKMNQNMEIIQCKQNQGDNQSTKIELEYTTCGRLQEQMVKMQNATTCV